MLILSLLSTPYVLVGLLLSLLIGITVHEFSHAWMATRLGDPTAKLMGRLSLNPLKHLDPFGTIFLLLVGFGWGRPVPYNPQYLRHGKKDEVKIALAGPLSNFILALIFALPYRLSYYLHLDWTQNPFFIIAAVITEINIILAVFNLLPIPPLDGSKIIFLFLSEETRAQFERIGPLVLMGLIFIVYIFRINLFGAVLSPVIELLLNFIRTFP
ncbi:MAG: metal-dependent protease [Candidatus Berkelbacteria bacterium Licking1014_96]|uniref:Metal-dependent protease n=1 Tax=Candidatus Berkelbacteria bacterium Licking1014_96 TaxID=2017149 RepID=A0A554LE21_9BACT|nr:MAG: metal-dependent protease [Candidatus Berkelbacteria bacterium Licking1014_96]